MNLVATTRLAGDKRGATVVEFAIVAPVMMLMLVGGLDMGHMLYVQAVLQGALQKAARDNGLEQGGLEEQRAAVDAKVVSSVRNLRREAQVKVSRRFYKTFSKAAAATAETYTDTNENHLCDDNEPFADVNGNGHLDLDGGDEGQGGAQDLVVYTAKVSFPRLLPLHTMIPAIPPTVNVQATTVLANQPYGEQKQYGAAKEGHCNP